MAKKELTEDEKKQKKLMRLKKYYDEAAQELNLTGDASSDVHALVMACQPIQREICEKSDTIKIDDLLTAQEITGIDKRTYLDFVRICSLKNNDKLHDKAINKFESDFEQRLFITNLRFSFLNSYMSGESLRITDENNEEYKPFSDYSSDEFEEIMNRSASTREYINMVCRKQYKKYSNAAQYITNLELKASDFKNLVDYEYYKEGGYPSPQTPAKLWSLFNKYNEAMRMMNRYGFTQQNSLNHEFGLNVELGEAHPVEHPWQRYENINLE